MKNLNATEIMQVSGGADNEAQCDNGYLVATINVPAHPEEQVLGVALIINGHPSYKKIADLVPAG